MGVLDNERETCMESNVRFGRRRHRVKKAKTWPAGVVSSLVMINSLCVCYVNDGPADKLYLSALCIVKNKLKNSLS
jgi:hypothetical protein